MEMVTDSCRRSVERTTQNWSTQRARASKGEVGVQMDTPPQQSQLVDSADEAKTGLRSCR